MGGGRDGQGYTAVRCAWKHIISLQVWMSLIAKKYKLFGTVKVNLCFILGLAFHILQLFPAFTLQSCFKLGSYAHSKASRGLSFYIRKKYTTL